MTDRREFLQGAMASAAGFSFPGLPMPRFMPVEDFGSIKAEIAKRHGESVRRLQNWIKLPSIAAENRNMNEGCQLMMEMLRDAGFGMVRKMPTVGHPGVFATLDAGAP